MPICDLRVWSCLEIGLLKMSLVKDQDELILDLGESYIQSLVSLLKKKKEERIHRDIQRRQCDNRSRDWSDGSR
jgi:hypothetical protein